MRKRLAISAFLLVGLTMSVAAFTDPPRASVELIDDGVTKVGKLTDLISDVTLITIKDLDRCVDVLVVTCDNASLAPIFDQKENVISLTPLPAIQDDHPVSIEGKFLSNLSTKKNSRTGAVKKIYLKNCCIRQCIQDAVAAA